MISDSEDHYQVLKGKNSFFNIYTYMYILYVYNTGL